MRIHEGRLIAPALALALSVVSACTDVPTVVGATRDVHAGPRAAYDQCDPMSQFYDACGPNGGASGGSGLAIGRSRSACFQPAAYDDIDSDSLSTSCEDALAASFAPMMRMSGADRNFVPAQGMVGGEYYFAVTRISIGGEERVRILYMPAYYRDEGSVTGAFESHNGDSEFITIDVADPYNSGVWETRQVFMSAHCGAVYNGDACGWYNAGAFEWYNGYLGAPIVWVSQDKHANYHSYQQCEWSADGVDRCSDNNVAIRFPVTPGYNIGSFHAQLVDVVGGRRPGTRALPGATESMWQAIGAQQFYGWLQHVGGATPYGLILSQMGFWGHPGSSSTTNCTDMYTFYCPS
jgi:hypothetical protein